MEETTWESSVATRPVYPWWLVLLQGIGAVLLGLVLVSALGATVDLLAQAMSWFWMVVAVAALVSIFVDGRLWGATLISGVLGIIAAVLVVDHPLWAGALVPVNLAWILGIYGIIAGATALVRAVMDGAGWALGALGLTVFLLGVALLSAPVIATAVLISVMSVFAIVGGIAAVVGALGERSAVRARREAAHEARPAPEAEPVPAAEPTVAAETPPEAEPLPEAEVLPEAEYPPEVEREPQEEREPEAQRDGEHQH